MRIVREAALRAIVTTGESPPPDIAEMLADPVAEVRLAAVAAVGELGGEIGGLPRCSLTPTQGFGRRRRRG